LSSLVTVISLPPSWVWLRRSAVREAVSFSNFTVADLAPPSVVMSIEAILPLEIELACDIAQHMRNGMMCELTGIEPRR
jgi:hypothetical protein